MTIVYNAHKHCYRDRLKQCNVNRFFKCFCVFLAGNLAQAEAVGREALELIPNDHSLMFSLANVLGKSQKYKVRKRQAAISCDRCQHLTEAINVTSAPLHSELGPNSEGRAPVRLGQFASWRSHPKDGFAGSDFMSFLLRVHYRCSDVGRGGEARRRGSDSSSQQMPPHPCPARSCLVLSPAVGLEFWFIRWCRLLH